MDSASTQRKSTGVVYHTYMAQHHCIWDPNYPERPERFTEILKRCEEMNLFGRCQKLQSREATREELLMKHSPDIIDLLQQCENKSEAELEEICTHFDSIYISPETYRASLLAAGSTLNLVEAICDNQILNGMAIVRPPGHHAMKSEYCGYCFFNNVAVAADYALKRYELSRILIVDWDVHHGQATQRMFYNDPRVLYFSIHRYDHGTFWPNLRESDCDFIGEGDGKGYNFNIPLNVINCGNADYLAIFHQILLPIAVEFNPELVLVSAGFDSALGDDKGDMKVTPACYAHFVNALSCFSGGKIAVVLEGGYFLKSLAEGAALTLRALLGDPCPIIGPVEEVQESVRESILNVIYTHRPFWKCFKSYDLHLPHLPPPEPLSFRHSVKFLHEETASDIFPTRDCYPVLSEEKKATDTAILNDLIKETKLYVPQFKAYLLCISLEKYMNEYQVKFRLIFLNGKDCCEYFATGQFTVGILPPVNCPKFPGNRLVAAEVNRCLWTIPILGLLLPLTSFPEKSLKSNKMKPRKKAVNCLLNHITGSVIIDSIPYRSQDHPDIKHFLMKDVFSYLQSQRTIFINFCSEIYFPETFTSDDNFLHISFHKTSGNSALSKERKNFIHFPWNNDTNENYIEAWLKVILPISYQFDPTVIVVFINFREKENLSPELFGYLVHWIMALANGKIILVTEYDPENELETASFLTSCKALLGNPLPTLKNINTISYETTNILKNICFQLSDKWRNLNFLVKFLKEEL